jgi:type IV pilus assembly protein PilX
MNMKSVGMGHRNGRRQQRGMISVLIAVVVLVVTLLAAVALMRSVDTSNTIAGSLTFRQSVIQEAERAYVDARTNINFNEPFSDSNGDGAGLTYYYSSVQPATVRPDMPDVLMNETAGGIHQLPQLLTGSVESNKVSYVVERLCPAGTGAASPTTCIVPGASIQGGSVSNQTKDNGPPFASGASAAFRLSVRVDGSKGTVGYVQTIMR